MKSRSYRRKDVLENQKRWKRITSIATSAAEGKLDVLNEMVIPLKTFIERAEGLKFEIARNWCLCKWCQTCCPEYETFNHWKEELMSCLDALHDSNIKNKIDKKKHLHRVLVEESDFNDLETVVRTIRGKFRKEGINDIEQINGIALMFTGDVMKLIDAISNKDIDIEQYMQDEFAA